MPLFWLMKGSYFCFGNPQPQVDMHARSKDAYYKTIKVFICNLFAQIFPNDSYFQTPPLHEGNLWWFGLIGLIFISSWACNAWYAAFVSAVLLCVQCYRGKRYFYCFKRASSGKKLISIFIQTNVKRPTSVRLYANVSCWHLH